MDVFISHSSRDKKYADAVCNHLENAKIRCWVAPRDIVPGIQYADAIISAIDDCEIFLIIWTDNANRSTHVSKEVERAVSKGKIIIPIRMDACNPTKTMEYYLSSEHWLDAMTPPFEKHLSRLVQAVSQLLDARVSENAVRRTAPDLSVERTAAQTPEPITEIHPDNWTASGSMLSRIRRLFQDS